MKLTETHLSWIVIKAPSGIFRSWTGRKFSLGFADAKLYALKSEAQAVAARYGAEVRMFAVTAAVAA